MEIYIGAYVKIPREKKLEEWTIFYCPVDEEHFKYYYPNSYNYCKECGAKIVSRTEQISHSRSNANLSDCEMPLFTSRGDYDYFVPESSDGGEILYAIDGESTRVLPASTLFNNEVEKLENHYKEFLKYLREKNIKHEICLGILISG